MAIIEILDMDELTPEQQQIEKDRYRFGGIRYGLRGPAHFGPDDFVPSVPGAFPMPADNNEENPKDFV